MDNTPANFSMMPVSVPRIFFCCFVSMQSKLSWNAQPPCLHILTAGFTGEHLHAHPCDSFHHIFILYPDVISGLLSVHSCLFQPPSAHVCLSNSQSPYQCSFVAQQFSAHFQNTFAVYSPSSDHCSFQQPSAKSFMTENASTQSASVPSEGSCLHMIQVQLQKSGEGTSKLGERQESSFKCICHGSLKEQN